MKKKYFIILILCFVFSAFAFTPPEWSRELSIYEVNVRQYTEEGTFSAFQEHLPRLQEMGVGILWLMPINPIGELNRKGTLGSYYAAEDYLKINPEFGDAADLHDLITDVHARGMYVIIDWVANHTAWDHVWTKSHPEFYKKDAKGNFRPPVKDWADVIQLDYSNAGLRQEMTKAMKYWVEEYDIDGFRCDVAEMVPLDFWIDARNEIESIKPVFMLAECENPAYHQAFDMTYAWSGFGLIKDISKGYKKIIDLDAYRMQEQQRYKKEDYRMLFLSNHDENSWSGSMMANFPESYKAFTVLTYALPGMPLIYSGQEAMNPRQLAFFDKDEIVWRDTEMTELYTNLNRLKKNNPVLFNGIYGGNVSKVANSRPLQVYSIIRKLADKEILFVINLSSETQSFNMPDIKGTYTEYMTHDIYDLEGETQLTLPPWDYLILNKDY
ncbi:MAG: alpha-amylase [Candidatus Cloacimonetes bacterium]|nr:alpha-amylase [Candidatus Cloacimonadota bacterium]